MQLFVVISYIFYLRRFTAENSHNFLNKIYLHIDFFYIFPIILCDIKMVILDILILLNQVSFT